MLREGSTHHQLWLEKHAQKTLGAAEAKAVIDDDVRVKATIDALHTAGFTAADIHAFPTTSGTSGAGRRLPSIQSRGTN
jgi:hypothetical protein